MLLAPRYSTLSCQLKSLIAAPLCLSVIVVATPSQALSPLPVGQMPPATSSAADAGVYSGYLLGQGDQLEITVYGYEEFKGAKVVLPDGSISLPVIGSVRAADRTVDVLTQEIRTRLEPLLVNPVVNINLTSLRPVVVNVAGQVQRPGSTQLRSLTNTTFQASGTAGITSGLAGIPTISSAIAAAGGVTRNADIQRVTLRRNLPGGQSSTVTLNLWNAIWSDQPPEDTVLRPGDSIYIPPLPEGSTLDRRLLAKSKLAPETVRVRVVGEVIKPGEVQISPDSSISSALAVAGGATKNARLREVALIRLDDKGQIATQILDLNKLNDTVQVQEGDVVFVPEKGGSKFLRGLGQVLTPFGNLLNILNGTRNLTN
jgi:polysaccharide biosynthesis/export protein